MRPIHFVVMLAIPLGCGASHATEDGGTEDGSDGGMDAFEPCPDFSCESRCSAISVCDCSVPGGEAICAVRYGVCVGTECVVGGVDAGIDTSPDVSVDVGDAPDAATSGVPCGEITCESPIAVCVVCPHEDFTDTHCFPADLDEDWPFRTAMESHPFCGFPGVFVQCDGPEDCVREDQECVFDGGEWGYARCTDPADFPFQVACRNDEDCEPGVVCGEVDPFGYFSAHFDTLGWRPHACGGAAREVSAFCDDWDAACEGAAGFFDRSSCLRTSASWTAEDFACAGGHLDLGACESAASGSPCAD